MILTAVGEEAVLTVLARRMPSWVWSSSTCGGLQKTSAG